MKLKLAGFSLNDKEEKVVDPNIGRVNEEELPTIETTTNAFGGRNYLDNASVDFIYEKKEELISQYRSMAKTAYVESAVDDIVDESIVISENNFDSPVALILDNTTFSENAKKKIQDEWDYFSSKIYNFRKRLETDFREWYIDGQKSFYLIQGKSKEGLKELRALDSLYIEQIVQRTPVGNNQVKLEAKWIYDVTKKLKSLQNLNKSDQIDNLFYDTAQTFLGTNHSANLSGRIEIEKDAIVHANSGLRDERGFILSYLHRAIKSYNAITNFENSILIYTIVRAPQRRIFYIDTGLLQGKKAEEYVNGMMKKYSNKMTFDSDTGDLRGSYNIKSMLEDYFIPRQNGERGTNVETLDGAGELTNIDFVNNYKKNLWEALRIPISRKGEDPSQFVLGRASEISRDEIKFKKFSNRVRQRFSRMFIHAFAIHLQLKNIITKQDRDENLGNIFLKFNTDNFFTELKDNEILQGRLELLSSIDEYVGKYFSKETVMKKVLQMNDDEIKEEQEKIEQELKDNPPEKEDEGF